MPPPRRPRKPVGPPVVSEGTLLSRAKGAMLGLAVGEAFGATNERRAMRADDFPKLNDGFHVDIKGGGPRGLKPGQVGWVTEMALCLATSMRNYSGYDVYEAGAMYRRWLPAEDCDAPLPVRLVIQELRENRDAEVTGRRIWQENGQTFKDNGALARTAPIGVFFCHERDERIRASLVDTAITHFPPICQLSSVVLNTVIATALTNAEDSLEREQVLKVLETDLALAASNLGHTGPEWAVMTHDATEFLRADIAAAQDDDPWLYGPELYLFAYPCHARTTLRLALWELFHAGSFEEALLDVGNRGGDCAVNCAVVGAVMGAVYGDRSIPERWVELVMDALPPISGPEFHPTSLITLEPHRPS